MRIKIGNGLLLLNLLVIVLIVVIILHPANVVRIILGVPTILFFPGYALVAALYPRRERMASVERVALSLGMSIAVVPLIGLVLNYTPWRLRLEPTLCSIVFLMFAMAVIAWFRRRKLLDEERFNIEFQLRIPRLGIGVLNMTLSIILVLVILVTLGMLGYYMATPKVGQRLTEFYVLGSGNKTTDYPTRLEKGEKGSINVDIVNREYETVLYQLDVKIDGIKSGELTEVVLAHGERWEGEVEFAPKMAGLDQKLEFLLYKDGEAVPHLEPLRLWLDVHGDFHEEVINNLLNYLRE
ncbi:DUF1616 domain-containing protein [Chloroflexota bacterium]